MLCCINYEKTILINSIYSFFSSNVFAALEVTISQGKVEPTPIAITDFFGSSDKAAKGGKILRELFQ